MENRRGSALLIVLGFLSFMVISAVAFSIYMRSERMPSSVFRRTTVSRHLVQAAVSRAVSELDNAIRDDPFPGLHASDYPARRNNGGRFLDEWYGRVFMPPNPGPKACPDHNSGGDLWQENRYRQDTCLMAPHDETAAVLNLEALGYVPAPLFNDVRFLSRLTWSAKWRPFDHGAGRFAYVAVNVSDYLDVNRLKDFADAFRSSGSRINLVPLLAGVGSFDDGIRYAGEFRTRMRTTDRGVQNDWPFVSLLDFYLDMKGGYANCKSPFYDWIGESRSGAGYLEGDGDLIKSQCFVTDSWLPDAPNEALAESAIIDLNDRGSGNNQDDESGQPFSRDWMQEGNNVTFQDIYNQAKSDFVRRVASGNLPRSSTLSGGQNKSPLPLDAALLKDYLDRDDTPISLALPCVERVPMVAAMGISRLNINLGLEGSTRTENGPMVTTTLQEVNELTEYKLNPSALSPGVTLTAAVMFPFKRTKDINQTFKAKALIRVFLVDETAIGLRVDGSKPISYMRPSDDADWNESKSFQLTGLTTEVAPFVFTFVSAEQTINTAGHDILEQQDVPVGNGAGNSVIFQFNLPNDFANPIVLTKKVKKHVPTDGGVTPPGPTFPPVYALNASPFAADGSLVETAKDNWRNEEDFNTAFGSRRFALHAAAWVYIEHPNGDVVDLVPAIAQDDLLYNSLNNSRVQQQGYDGFNIAGTPIFRFRSSSASAVYDVANATSPLNIPAGNWTPGAYCAVDPRFNWAPEDWLPRNQTVTGDAWVDWITGRNADNGTDELLAEDGRDSDIFMFVSNQGFLQSMGELAFLPRVTYFSNQTVKDEITPIDLLRIGCAKYDGTEIQDSDSWRKIPNADLVWRTYRSYNYRADRFINDYGIIWNGNESCDFLLDFCNFYKGSSAPSESQAFRNFGAKGVRVNPYSDSDSVRMAAFAYTPYDWWAAAGTNTLWATSNSKDSEGARRSKFKELSNSRKYTFHESSSEAKMKDSEIRAIGKSICDAIRNAPASTWQNVYDGLDWYGNGTINPFDGKPPYNENVFRNLLGVNLDEPLHSVDRKYLYAYWRDCLANRQQLFLVFVRAESGALGSGGDGKVPPQQGGRAVALVWRDPTPPQYPGLTDEVSRTRDADQYVRYDSNSENGSTVRRPHRTQILFFHQFD